MIAATRLAEGVANNLLTFTHPDASPHALIQDAFRRGFELGRSLRSPSALPSPPDNPRQKEERHGPS
jgi:hypothetical protein